MAGVSSRIPVHTLDYQKGFSDGDTALLALPPLAPTDQNRHSSTSFAPPTEEVIHIACACEFTFPACPALGVGLSGILPQTPNSAMGTLLMTPDDIQYNRLRGSRTRIDRAVSPRNTLAFRADCTASDDPVPSLLPPPSVPLRAVVSSRPTTKFPIFVADMPHLLIVA